MLDFGAINNDRKFATFIGFQCAGERGYGKEVWNAAGFDGIEIGRIRRFIGDADGLRISLIIVQGVEGNGRGAVSDLT